MTAAPRVQAARAGPARTARDFYVRLMRDSQPRPALLAERERWLRSVRVEGREERLFEFELLLRGIERYFQLHNLPIDAEARPVVTRDFGEELRDVRDAVQQAIRLARRLLDPGHEQKMVFRHYLGSQAVDDRVRRALLEDEVEQETPQESLFLIAQSFESLRVVVDHLLDLEAVGYRVFHEVGSLAVRAILQNRYFRPFRPLEFCLEFDRIRSVPVLDALRLLPDPERQLFTTAFLGLFRLLHSLAYLRPAADRPADRRARVLLALIRSEALTLAGYLRTEVAANTATRSWQHAALRTARDMVQRTRTISRSLSGEGAADEEKVSAAARNFAGLFEGAVVGLARAVDARGASEGYARLVAPALMAQRLRNDLWVSGQLAREAAGALTGPGDPGPSLEALLRFESYFQDGSYQLLRYGDVEAVDRFLAILAETAQGPEGPLARARLAEDCALFADTAEALFVLVGRRSDVAGRRFDRAHAEAVLDRFRR
ncbi:MAG TPA: hypothetical protein VK454_01740 [Myxococcaceae bacterium]|nr:hypothetical protein [Myxococcaceae bacterium]